MNRVSTMRAFIRILMFIDRGRNHRLDVLLLTGFAFGLLAEVPSQCSGQLIQRSPIIEERVEQVLRKQAHQSGAAGLAFGMVQQGRTIVLSYAGYASWADKTPIDASTVFNWASLSKGVTAVCALKMAEQGRLDLDADIKKYIPEIKVEKSVTLRDLLVHRAGIGGYAHHPRLNELEKLEPKSLTQDAILAKMTLDEFVFEPGTQVEYSSPGYILLSIAMERAASKSYAELVDEIVAKPLKLSSLRAGGISEADAIRYRLVNGQRQRVEDVNDDWRLGAGTIKSNLPEALVFASSLIQSSILTPESSKELFKRHFNLRVDGELVGVTYGFMRSGEGAEATILAVGNQPGARSFMIIYPRAQVASLIFGSTTPLDIERIHLEAMRAATKDEK